MEAVPDVDVKNKHGLKFEDLTKQTDVCGASMLDSERCKWPCAITSRFECTVHQKHNASEVPTIWLYSKYIAAAQERVVPFGEHQQHSCLRRDDMRCPRLAVG